MGSTEDLFEGPPTGLPGTMSSGGALYHPAPGRAAKVRHVGGYAPFLGFCAVHDVQADELVSDPDRLIRFLRAFAAQIESDTTLKVAAAIFAGNVIARLRPDAYWTTYDGGSAMVGNREKQFDIDRLLNALRTVDDESLHELLSVLSDWAREEVDDSPAAHPRPIPPSTGQPRYVRPPLPTTTYYSPAGEPIPYGRRWGADGPAPDSYSVDSHPERFAGLHVVAHALIDHLSAVYDVDVDVDPAHAADLLVQVQDVVQAVRVTPRSSGAASMTLVLTGYPGVMVHAGVLHDFPFPVCGCEACDETAETAADRLEMLVLAVAAGGYSERYPVGRHRWTEYALTAVDGSGSESGRGEPVPAAAARLRNAEIQLGDLAGAWRHWPLRETTS